MDPFQLFLRDRSASESTLVGARSQPARGDLSNHWYDASVSVETLVDDDVCKPVADRSLREIRHRRAGGGFINPWPSANPTNWISELLSGPFVRQTPVPLHILAPRTVAPDFCPGESAEGTRVTWLGHASVLVQLPGGPNILFDPVLSNRASPLSFAGPKRSLQAPCSVHELPNIDVVCISHSHYDHLETRTVEELARRAGGSKIRWLIPLGNAKSLLNAGVSMMQITEMDWWDEMEIADQNEKAGKGKVVVACTPAQHGSCRSPWDRNRGLWSSWVVSYCSPLGHNSRFFFGGDTGYRGREGGPACPAFAEVGRLYGPFDIACIPIWRGACLSFLSKFGLRLRPEAFTRHLHATPADAVDMLSDLQAKVGVAIHWGTFVQTDEARWSIGLLELACLKAGIAFAGSGTHLTRLCPEAEELKGRNFVVLEAGQTLVAP